MPNGYSQEMFKILQCSKITLDWNELKIAKLIYG